MTDSKETLAVAPPSQEHVVVSLHGPQPVESAAGECQDVEEYFDLQENLHRPKREQRRTDWMVAGIYLSIYAIFILLCVLGYYVLHLWPRK